MYMYQSEFEDAALKAYFEDPWTESDDSGEDSAEGAGSRREQTLKEGGEPDSSRNSKYGDIAEYEGGSSSKSNKK